MSYRVQKLNSDAVKLPITVHLDFMELDPLPQTTGLD